jgi:hypothetical protein
MAIRSTPTPNANTSWTLYMKCETVLNTTIARPSLNACRLSEAGAVVPFTSPTCNTRFNPNITFVPDSSTTFVSKYIRENGATSTLFAVDHPYGALNCTYDFIRYASSTSCINNTGSITITRNNNEIYIQMSSATDYNRLKSEYLDVKNWMDTVSPIYSGADDTLPAYYQYYKLKFLTALNGNCGDIASQINIKRGAGVQIERIPLHYTTPITFDDVLNKITISYVAMPLVSLGSCTSCATTVHNEFRTVINQLAAFIGNEVTLAGATSVVTFNSNLKTFEGHKMQRSLDTRVSVDISSSMYIRDVFLIPVQLTNAPFNSGTSVYKNYSVINKYFTSTAVAGSGWTRLFNEQRIWLMFSSLRFSVTATTNNGADAANNYRVFSFIDQSGSPTSLPNQSLVTGTGVLIYEVSGGVVTTNAWCTTTTTTTPTTTTTTTTTPTTTTTTTTTTPP